MGRKSKYKIGDMYGNLEIVDVLPSRGKGTHVSLKCICHYCNAIVVMSGANLYKRKSCGCQQHNSGVWSSKGPKTKPWQLPAGEAAKNVVEYQYKKSASNRNLEYTLTREQFEQIVTGNCVYCGDANTNTRSGGGKTSGDFSYTGIDRKNSDQGYTPENSVSCCWTCNSMKNDFTVEQFMRHIEKILRHTSGNTKQNA